MDITIQAPELERLQRKFRQAPEIVHQEIIRAVDQATLDAQREIVDRTPNNTGNLAGAIQSRLDPGGEIVRGFVEVANNAKYAAAVEFGRAPGKPPPIAAITKWVHQRGLGGRTYIVKSGKNAGQEKLVRGGPAAERAIAWAIRASIAKRGTKSYARGGVKMFRDGTKAAEPQIRAEFARVVVRIRKRLESSS